jgi:hypothetical protein
MKRFETLIIVGAFLFFVSCNQKTEKKNQKNIENQDQVEQNETIPEEIPEQKQQQAQTTVSETEPFAELRKLVIDDKESIYLKYSEGISEVYNTTLEDLDPSDPFYPEDEGPMMWDIKAIKTKINASSNDEYYVIYSSGPSADPTYIFYKDGEFERAAFYISALQVYLPGNGFIYSSGHTNNNFNTRKKYQIVGNQLKEIYQPYYYVGLETKTLKEVKLLSSKPKSEVLANLPKGYEVEILLNEKGTNWYLVRTKFGLCGWVEVEGFEQTTFEGIFYNGD